MKPLDPAEHLIKELADISSGESSFEDCFANILTLLVRKTGSEFGCIFAEFEHTDRILSGKPSDVRPIVDRLFGLYRKARRERVLATRPYLMVRELHSPSNRSAGKPKENGVIYPLHVRTTLCGVICLCKSQRTTPLRPVILNKSIVRFIAEIYRLKKQALLDKHHAVETAVTELVTSGDRFHRLPSIILTSLDLCAVILLTHDNRLSCLDVIMADSDFPTAVKNVIGGLHIDLDSNPRMQAAFRKHTGCTVFKVKQVLRMFAGDETNGQTSGIAQAVRELRIGDLLLSPSGYSQDGRMLYLVAVKKASRTFMKYETRSFQHLSRIVSLAFEKRTVDRIQSRKVSSAEAVQRISRRIIDDSDIHHEAKSIQQELKVHSCIILQLDRLENALRVEGFSSSITMPDSSAHDAPVISLESLYRAGYSQSDLHQFRISPLSEYANLIAVSLRDERQPPLPLLADYQHYRVIRIPLFDSYRRLLGMMLLLNEPDQEIPSSETDIMRDVGSKIANALEIRQNIYYDALTGLPNLKRLRSILIDRSISAEPYSVIICKIVNLDDVVIARGDEVADKCIVAVTKRIKGLIEGDKENIAVFRNSGEASFVVLFPSVDASEVADFAGRLIRCISMPTEVDGNVVSLQTNAGACPSTGIWETDMIVNYSKLAIQAISDRRNAFCVFDAEMQMSYLGEKELEEDIRKSLSARDFIPHYQPKVSCDGRIIGYEALARWKRGSLLESPYVFVDKIQRMGMVGTLFDIILAAVCKNMTESTRLGAVSINLSPSQLGEEKGLLQSVSRAVSRYSIDPGRLTFEFVETAMLDAEYYNTIRELKGMGFKVSLDDFGTGYARYKTLVDLFNQRIVNEIKIDKVFIDDIELSANQSFIRSISYLAEEFGIDTVAEGVETIDQLSRIRSINPSVIVQGFLVARALSCEEIESFDEHAVSRKFREHGV
jgi:EAL domain-containing protein (putative c-di-GMP-specific phosphodiesterase class I)/GGDEF domain-containing protein